MKMRFNAFLILSAVAAGSFATSGAWAAYVPGSLKGHWKLDQTTGTTVVDTSGNANDGVMRDGTNGLPINFVEGNGAIMNTNGPTINAVTQNAVELDGNDDVLKAADSASLDFDKTRGTISVWLNSDLDARMTILRNVTGSAYDGLALEKTGSGPLYRVYFTPNVAQAGYFMSQTAPVNNTWQHYVFTWDYSASPSGVTANPNRVKCYVDGVPTMNYTGSGGGSADTAFTAPASSTGDWIWGRRQLQADINAATTRPFDGEMAEIAVFDTAISATDAANLYSHGVNTLITTDNAALAANLKAYWNFSEGTGTTVADDSGNANTLHTGEIIQDATFPIGPSATWSIANSTGKPSYISRALQFDGANDLFTIPDSASLDFVKDKGTIVLWAYVNGTGRQNVIGDTSGSIVAQISSSARMAFAAANSSDFIENPINGVVAGTWVHYAYYFDQSQPLGTTAAPNRVRIFRNGTALMNSTANLDTTYSTVGTTADWVVGRKNILTDAANARWLDGQLADIAVFSEPLSASDIADVIANGVDAFAVEPDTTAPTSSATITAVAQVGANVSIDFIADDGAGSGVASTSLFVRTPNTLFADSGLTPLTGTTGTFNYTAADGNGLYQFYTVATDNSSNVEGVPGTFDDEIVVSLVENSAVTLPYDSGTLERTFPMEVGLNVTITFAAVGADGTVTVSRTEGATGPAGYDVTKLIGQHLTITTEATSSKLLAPLSFTDATLAYGYDPALIGSSITEGDIAIAIADDGGSITEYATPDVVVDTVGNTITISGIDEFSDWYAGSTDSSVSSWMILGEE